MSKLIDLIGQKFNRLTAIKRVENNKHGHIQYQWKCDCGNVIIASGQSVKRGNTKSCGCLLHDTLVERNYKHGRTKSRLYMIWAGIKQRCYKETSTVYEYYGKKGIRMSIEWKDNFSNFESWAISSGYKEGLTIERIDFNSDYCPENCKWIPLVEQQKNKSNVHKYCVNGEMKTIPELASEYSIRYKTLYRRLVVDGWEIYDALSIKPQIGNNQETRVKGETNESN